MDWKGAVSSFKDHLSLERGLSENTIKAYLHDIKLLKDFLIGDISPKEVSVDDIQSFASTIYDMGFSEYSQARIFSGIRSFFSYMVQEEWIAKDPTEFLDSPKLSRKLPDTLSFEEIELILQNIDLSVNEGHRNRAIIEILYGCGLRVSELVELKISNLFLDVGFLKVLGKGDKERLVPIGREAKKFLTIYLKDFRQSQKVKKGFENHVFLNYQGSKLSRISIFKMVKKQTAIAGILKEVSPHTFRHSYATHMVENGADLRIVQELLGHESITTTEIYTHLDREHLTKIIEECHPRAKIKF
ncbi:MAG: site-specific tyrosine recombinase XerD [Cytophagales bacterium]